MPCAVGAADYVRAMEGRRTLNVGIGVAIGTAIGVAIDNVAMGIGVGLAIGIALSFMAPPPDGAGDA
jgi:hypothetical protein